MRWEDKREEWVKMAEKWKNDRWGMYRIIWEEELFLRRMERNLKARVVGYRFGMIRVLGMCRLWVRGQLK